jgi:hypothetical protein
MATLPQETVQCLKDYPAQVSYFGCNGKSPQSAYVVGAAVATTGATNSSPYGFTTAAQADAIVARLNAVIAALVANGIAVNA